MFTGVFLYISGNPYTNLKLWAHKTYDKDIIQKVYKNVLANGSNFAFFLFDDGKPKGFCHGHFFDTFWHSGQTCYLASIIVNQEERKKGYGGTMLDHAKELAKEKGCHAIILDSSMIRKESHEFYEDYGFEKSAFCFGLILG